MKSINTRFVLSDAGPMRLMARLAYYVRQDAPRPLTIVVPSQVLVRHVGRYLARGGGLLGVQVVTLHRLAEEILEATGAPWTCHEQIATLLVGRALKEEPALYAELRATTDKPHLALTGSISDLRHAGLDIDLQRTEMANDLHHETNEPHIADICIEALDAPAAVQAHIDSQCLQRAKAVIRIAQAVSKQAQILPPCTDLYARAAQAVEQIAAGWRKGHSFCVYGFSDATGAALDLMEALTRHRDTALFLDLPVSHTAAIDGPNPAWSFTNRLQERLSLLETFPSPPPGEEDVGEQDASHPGVRDPHSQFSFVSAPNPRAEIRAVGLAIAARLDQGVLPESIAVVARDLSAYVAPIRTLFSRMGIPYSNPSDAPGLSRTNSGPIAPLGRKLKALCDLLQQGSQAQTDLLLQGPSLLAPSTTDEPGPAWSDLWQACQILGIHHLGDLSEAMALMDRTWMDRDTLDLPIRPYVDPDGDPNGETSRHGRTLPVATVRQWLERLAAIDDMLANWPRQATFAEHVELLETLATKKLDWWSDCPPSENRPVSGCRDQTEFAAFFDPRRLSKLLPPALPISKQEFFTAVQAHFDGVGRTALGGNGGGVQIMTVTQARACTFEHLFLVGLNKGLFPRQATEDLFLPDRIRILLRPVLGDLPIKMEGITEDQYLFDQLLSAAPNVHLSWNLTSNEETNLLVSPLVEQLRLVQNIGDDQVVRVPIEHPAPTALAQAIQSSHDGNDSDILALRDAADLAILDALANPGSKVRSSNLVVLLDQAEREAIQDTRHVDGPNASPTHQANPSKRIEPTPARARLNILAEQDAHPDSGPGPYLGLVFHNRKAASWVTQVEAMAHCPWRTFLDRVLRVEPPAGDSLDLEASLVGAALHKALQLLVSDQLPQAARKTGQHGPGNLDEIVTVTPTPISWPEPERLERIVDQACRDQLAKAGLDAQRLEVVLRGKVARFLEAARTSDWAEDPPLVLGCEISGSCLVDGRTLRFRADRVDRVADSVLLVDYKTGKRPNKNESKPQKMLNDGRFQAMAYAMARNDASGRYLYLSPDLDDADRRIDFGPEEKAAHADTFEQRVVPFMDGLSRGLFPPIPIKPRIMCDSCSVRPVCLRLDTSLAARLDRWADDLRKGETNQKPKWWQETFAGMTAKKTKGGRS
ncbi:MAG: PD-(D/E)XK nuclease family protein [Deltaproteobacteria bacterium]|nr:PD-(D/E)XK nuclease family protein [Deltaproteobacteria bacterium]